MSKTKLSKNCYWRGGVIWAKKIVKGEVHRFSLETSDAGVAKARVRAEVAKLVAQASFGDERKSWARAVEGWGQWVEREAPFGKSTYDRYITSLDQTAPYLEGLYVDQIDREKIDEIVAGRRNAGASVATIRRDLTAMSSVLRWCVDEGWKADNPALVKLQSRRFRERRDPIVLPDPVHIGMVIERAPGMLAKLTRAALLTGCRQAELVNATHGNFDRVRKQLTVIGKGNKRRTINLSDEAFALLDDLPTYLRCPHLFWHDEGEPYRNASSQFAALVSSVEKEAQKKGTAFRAFRFHDLRHYYAVDHMKNGGDLRRLQLHLGHGSISTTEWYLKFLTPEEAMAAKFGTQNGTQMQRSDAGEIAETA